MGRRQGGAGNRPPDECKVAWCNESLTGHTNDGHVGYLLSEIVKEHHTGHSATLEVLLVGHDEQDPRLTVGIGAVRPPRHLAVLLTDDQVAKVREAMSMAALRIGGAR